MYVMKKLDYVDVDLQSIGSSTLKISQALLIYKNPVATKKMY